MRIFSVTLLTTTLLSSAALAQSPNLPNADILLNRAERQQQYNQSREAWEQQRGYENQPFERTGPGFGRDRRPEDLAPIPEPTPEPVPEPPTPEPEPEPPVTEPAPVPPTPEPEPAPEPVPPTPEPEPVPEPEPTPPAPEPEPEPTPPIPDPNPTPPLDSPILEEDSLDNRDNLGEVREFDSLSDH